MTSVGLQIISEDGIPLSFYFLKQWWDGLRPEREPKQYFTTVYGCDVDIFTAKHSSLFWHKVLNWKKFMVEVHDYVRDRNGASQNEKLAR